MELPPEIVAVIVVCGIIGIFCIVGMVQTCYSGTSTIIKILLCPVCVLYRVLKWFLCGCKNSDNPIYMDATLLSSEESS